MDHLSILLMSYFNSIKVRLELLVCVVLWSNLLFQFHKGTIRTVNVILSCLAFLYFNSIKVRLEHFPFSVSHSAISYFNSIKVRLELCVHFILCHFRMDFNSIKVRLEHNKLYDRELSELFQFHKGTIRTHSGR